MTIRLRLTLWYTALLGVTLILFSVAVYSALATNMWGQVQGEAQRQARQVAETLGQYDLLIIRNDPARIEFGELDLFASGSGVQIVSLDGMIARRSSNLGAMVIPNYRSALDKVSAGQEDIYFTPAAAGNLFLVYSVPLKTRGRVIAAVQVVKQVQAVENALNQTSRYLILGTAFSLILAAIVGAFLARQALAPVDTITDTASGITRTKDLSQRLTIAEDRSEVGRLAATFNAMLDQLQALFNTQQQLIADVSHELRTPLTTIQGNVELLQRMTQAGAASNGSATLNELLPEVLDEVQSEADRMNRMTNDLLLLAQADSGALQLQMAPVEMDTLLLDVYRQGQRLIERTRGHDNIQLHLGSEDQAQVLGDESQLRQVLWNLVDNAIKYAPAGGAVTLGLENQGGWVKVWVSDTGLGISREHQAQIFQRFYRTDKARSREVGGSGLGLSIVKSITEAHGGHVTVESEPQRGSIFTVWLPELAQDGSQSAA